MTLWYTAPARHPGTDTIGTHELKEGRFTWLTVYRGLVHGSLTPGQGGIAEGAGREELPGCGRQETERGSRRKKPLQPVPPGTNSPGLAT